MKALIPKSNDDLEISLVNLRTRRGSNNYIFGLRDRVIEMHELY